jgi:hypothetical protein
VQSCFLAPLSILHRVLAFLQNALLHKLFWAWPTLQALLEIICSHVEVELPLVSLQGGRGRRVREDIALDKVISKRALVQAFLEIVCCALALELEGFGL